MKFLHLLRRIGLTLLSALLLALIDLARPIAWDGQFGPEGDRFTSVNWRISRIERNVFNDTRYAIFTDSPPTAGSARGDRARPSIPTAPSAA
jgi:hypothetical protein